MARRRASMREGPLAELFRATEAAQRQAEQEPEQQPAGEAAPATEPDERTVDHVPSWEEAAGVEPPPAPAPAPPAPRPDPMPQPPAPDPVPDPAPVPDPVPQIRAMPPVTRYIDPLPEQPARLHRVPRGDTGSYLAVIKVVGIGGSGPNALNLVMGARIHQVEFVAVNTDMQARHIIDAPPEIQ